MFADKKRINEEKNNKIVVGSQIVETIFCPNCGKEAHNYHVPPEEILRTSCRSCDYLMIKCARSGKVIEAYAPGIRIQKTISNK